MHCPLMLIRVESSLKQCRHLHIVVSFAVLGAHARLRWSPLVITIVANVHRYN